MFCCFFGLSGGMEKENVKFMFLKVIYYKENNMLLYPFVNLWVVH